MVGKDDGAVVGAPYVDGASVKASDTAFRLFQLLRTFFQTFLALRHLVKFSLLEVKPLG